jgi:hypothetical protein
LGCFVLSVVSFNARVLFAKKLHGNIPADIDDYFPRIQGFSLGANQYSGVIPSSISNLTTLRGLWLSINRFSGFVSPNLGRLQSLEHLFLHETHVESIDKKG